MSNMRFGIEHSESQIAFFCRCSIVCDFIPGLTGPSAKRKLPEETAEEMDGKKHFLP